MVEINYEALGILMQAKKISRRQLASLIGVSPDTFAGSFRRKSKMKIEQVWKISDIFGIDPTELLFKDRDGNYNQEDYKLVSSRRSDRDLILENQTAYEITNTLKKLNRDGLNTVQAIVSIMCEVPRFKREYTTTYDPEKETLQEAMERLQHMKRIRENGMEE